MRRPNGRRRVAIERMENAANRQVTFSKRRGGFFKKATELCTLCGAHLAIAILSEGKAYSCGHPDVESIVDKFLELNLDAEVPNPVVVPQQNPNADTLNRQINRLTRSIEKEKERGRALQALRTEPPIEELSLSELKRLCEALEFAEEEAERVYSQQLECLIEFPYQTLGSALAPLRDVESTSSDSDDEGPSGSNAE